MPGCLRPCSLAFAARVCGVPRSPRQCLSADAPGEEVRRARAALFEVKQGGRSAAVQAQRRPRVTQLAAAGVSKLWPRSRRARSADRGWGSTITMAPWMAGGWTPGWPDHGPPDGPIMAPTWPFMAFSPPRRAHVVPASCHPRRTEFSQAHTPRRPYLAGDARLGGHVPRSASTRR